MLISGYLLLLYFFVFWGGLIFCCSSELKLEIILIFGRYHHGLIFMYLLPLVITSKL